MQPPSSILCIHPLVCCQVTFFIRRALEAKAALYDRLSRGEGLKELEEEEEGGDEEGSHRYMVDFTKKVYEVSVTIY